MYGGFAMVNAIVKTPPINQKKKTQSVQGVTGVDFDSDEEQETNGRYGARQKNDDDDDFEREESLDLDELDGWMEKINKARKQSLEDEKEAHKQDDQDIRPGSSEDQEDEEDEFDFITEHMQKKKQTDNNQELKREESFGAVLQRHDSELEQFEINSESEKESGI